MVETGRTIDIDLSENVNSVISNANQYARRNELNVFWQTNTFMSNTSIQADLTATGTLTAPTINASAALQINGTSTSTLYASKPWIQCIFTGSLMTILANSSVGRVTPTITRTSGQSAGAYDVAFTTHPNGFNYTHSIQVRADSGFATGVISNVSTGSCKVRLYNASQVLTDYQFSLIIFA